jgi:hypothetical protein
MCLSEEYSAAAGGKTFAPRLRQNWDISKNPYLYLANHH